MYLKYILIPALLCIFPTIVSGIHGGKVDYCGPDYTCSGLYENHVLACGHNGKFDESCPSNVEMLPMNDELKNLFLHEHNNYRNEIAGGSNNFKPAAAMATLEWDDELAYFAELNVKQCRLIYETEERCFKTARYKALDQNIDVLFYQRSRPDCSTIYKDIKAHMRDSWYSQYRYVKQAEINSYRPPETNVIHHFGKMAMDRNNRLGCAAAIIDYGAVVTVPFTCNYARRLVPKKPIFLSGSKAGAKCKTGKHSKYTSLCSTKEKVDPNAY